MGNNDKEVTNRDVYDLVQQVMVTVNGLKNEIVDLKNNLQLKDETINNLVNKVTILEESNTRLESKLYNTEKKIKRNNLVIFGVEENSNTPLLEIIKTIFSEKLNVVVQNSDINDIYRIGKRTGRNKRPIVVRFISNLKKREVFSNARLLKNTGVAITDDLTEQERIERKFLYDSCRVAQGRGHTAKITGNRLVINGTYYSYEDLKGSVLHPQGIDLQKVLQNTQNTSEPSAPKGEEITGFEFEKEVFSQVKEKKISGGRREPTSKDPAVETRSRSNSKSSQSSEKSSAKIIKK